jgi:xanthine dehydrogenase large subunit
VAEVKIDTFTGMLVVERVDILMDYGKSINPGIDRGQTWGGFIQGMGWATTEELRYGPKGDLLSHSPTTYKIPNVEDTPRVFNIAFLDNAQNVMAVRSSKAVGEPPLLLGIAVWAAVKDALAHRTPQGVPVRLDLPASIEEIVMRLAALGPDPGPGGAPKRGAQAEGAAAVVSSAAP